MNQWPLLTPLERCRHFCQTWRWAKLSVSQSLIARVSGILWLKRGQRSIIWSTFSLLNCMRLALNHLKYFFLAKLNEIGLYANSTYIERLTIQHLLGGSFWKKSWTRVSNTSYLTLNLTPSLAPGSPSTRNRRVCSAVERVAAAVLQLLVLWEVHWETALLMSEDGGDRDLLGSLSASTSSLAQIGEESCSPFLGVRHLLSSEVFWILCHLVKRLAVGIHFVSCPNWRRVLLSISWCSAPS